MILLLLRILLFATLLNVEIIKADPVWEDEAFTCNPSYVGDITSCQYNSGILLVHFKEQIHHILNIAYINCDDCSDDSKKPQIGSFSFGSNSLLGATITLLNNKWVLQITKKQDYLTKEQQYYKFEVIVGSDTRSVFLTIVEIDANPPRITVNQLPCTIPENFEGESNCTYEIEDPDEMNDISKVTFYLDPANLEEHFQPTLIDYNNTDANAILMVIKSLDFETNPVYYYTMHSKDDLGVEDQAKIIIQVQDVDDQPPKWIQIFSTKTFNEKTEQEFHILALDGDIQINTTISYELDKDCHPSISVKREDTGWGTIHVNPINRDILENDFVTCTVTAFQLNNRSMSADAEITMILIDVNDNAPIITPNYFEQEIKAQEITSLTQVVTINDIDEGKNAQYDVILYSDDKENFHEAFQIMPTNGYKEWNFTISVVKPELLDYAIEKWRKFQIHIKSDDGLNTNTSTIQITLQNMNTRSPVFDPPSYNVTFKETVPANYEIVTLHATDADYGDSVVYDLCIDSQKQLFSIDQNTGVIKTINDNTFDYSKQPQVLIQVFAQDTFKDGEHELHKVITQVTVNLIDVNDKKPRILLPDYSPQIEENSPDETLVTSDLKAEDIDTYAYLQFSINWDKTWATKQGRNVDQQEFENVFKIETHFDDPTKNGYATGILKVNDVLKLDYEKYEIIYLLINVANTKQEVNDGTDTATLTVTLIDVNDNPPIFNNDTINSYKNIDENSRIDTLISTVTATDADGPNFNVITYSIRALNGTKEGLVKIDPKTGALMVAGNIDADKPKTYYLYYNVMARDVEFMDQREIQIFINDLNDEKPRLQTPLEPMSIKEGYRNETLQYAKGIDDDRDSPHNLVTYYLNVGTHNELSGIFQVIEETGEVRVDATIDRDAGQTHFDVFLILRDNFNGTGVTNEDATPHFELTILDVNNKRPLLPTDLILPDISQNDPKGLEIIKIYADDKDQPCTDNTRIDYRIINITTTEQTLKDAIFDITSNTDPNDPLCKYYGILEIGEPLVNYYGKFSIAIGTADRGDPILTDERIYPINIKPYNYQTPTITFPKNNEQIILQKEQTVGHPLITIDTEELQDFQATDNQNNKFKIHFEILENTGIFVMHSAQLQLKQIPEQTDFTLTVQAKHDGVGNASSSTENKFQVLFIDRNALPQFTQTEFNVSFLENEYNRSVIPKALDPKCYSDDCIFKTYYHIIKGDEHKNFSIISTNPDAPELIVVATLDRESIDFYELTIVATNDKNPPVNVPDEKPLIISVTVLDENDNPPHFTKKLFSGSMTVADKPDRTVVELLATDVDLVDQGKLTYYIVAGSMEISDSSLNNVKDNPFRIEKVNNVVSNFQPIKEMKGFFTFKALVMDSFLNNTDHEDTATVKIYIIADDNRVVFTFGNAIEDVIKQSSYIEQVFSDEFKYSCTIDETYKKADDSGKTLVNQTNVKTHFIDTTKNEPVDKDTITVKVSDLDTISRLRLKFMDHHLNFIDAPQEKSNDKQNMEKILMTLLIVVSVVLGTLCIVLLIIFCVKTRNLKKRLNAMTDNQFGSVKSDLNRVGINAPGTNKHAIEANPFWNEDVDNNIYDTMSQGSGGSDLIGIEDNPEFLYLPNTNSDSVNYETVTSAKSKSLNPLASGSNNERY